MSNADPSPYITAIEAWRRQREADLRAPDGWLSLTGLYLLADGTHTVGSDAANDVVLPASAPAQLGRIEFQAGEALLNVTTDSAADTAVLVDGAPLRTAQLVDNSGGRRPTLVTVGTVSFFIHKFGDQHAVRVKDSANPASAAFAGRRWFPVRPEYRVQGRFTPFADPQEIRIGTVVNTDSVYRSVGALDFELQGRQLRLLASAGGTPGQLFIVFRDATAGNETYGAARFLNAEVGPDRRVEIDFNQAYNPPCAFTPYATCPLPPPDNILAVRISAGEMVAANSHDMVNTQHDYDTVSFHWPFSRSGIADHFRIKHFDKPADFAIIAPHTRRRMLLGPSQRTEKAGNTMNTRMSQFPCTPDCPFQACCCCCCACGCCTPESDTRSGE